MNFLRDRQARLFLVSVIILLILFLAFAGVFCLKQTQTAKELLLLRDGTMTSSLMAQGVSEDIIARAIANGKDDGNGKELLTKLGYTTKTSPRFLPAVRHFQTSCLSYAFTGTLVFIGILLSIILAFLTKREQLYDQAANIISYYSKGNFTTHLPKMEDGTLFRLFASVDNLAAALQAKGETEYKSKIFLKNTISDISHQLKTPLAALSMYNEIILNEPENPDIITQFSEKTGAALNRMEQLIQSLLKITRLDAGNITFEKSPHLLSEIIAQAMLHLTTRASREQKQILISGQPEDQTITCDFLWTSEAIGNIVKNALNHTSSGGHIHIYWQQSPAMLQITIKDDGTGIANEDIYHIFKRFYRSKYSKDHQGVGLGLPLAKAIIEGQGGILSVQSTLGTGTAFTISFLTES